MGTRHNHLICFGGIGEALLLEVLFEAITNFKWLVFLYIIFHL